MPAEQPPTRILWDQTRELLQRLETCICATCLDASRAIYESLNHECTPPGDELAERNRQDATARVHSGRYPAPAVNSSSRRRDIDHRGRSHAKAIIGLAAKCSCAHCAQLAAILGRWNMRQCPWDQRPDLTSWIQAYHGL